MMWDKPWVKWVVGLAAFIGAVSYLGSAGWAVGKPAARGIVVELVVDSPEMEQKVIGLLVAENAALKEQLTTLEGDLIILRSQQAQEQRVLGKLETQTEDTAKNVDLLLKLFLERENVE